MGRTQAIEVGAEDRRELESWLRSSSTKKSLAERARIVLLSAQGETIGSIAEKVLVDRRTVYKWRRRYVQKGLVGLRDQARSGRPRKLSSAEVQKILELTTQQRPRESTHWSQRLMVKHAGVTQWQVRQVWAAADLRPHRLKTFKISNDPLFADKVIDVVGLYMQPPANAVVLSVDEKTQIQALDRTQPMLPLRPGQIERRTHDYKRHGTTSLYAALDIATGEVLGQVTERHTAKEFLEFLTQIDRKVAPELDLHLILDNSSTHKTAEVRAFVKDHPRLHFHFTPTSASWLNAVEGWFSRLERRALYRGVFTSVPALNRALRSYIKTHNTECAKPFVWTKPAACILDAVNRAKASAEGAN